MAASNSLVTALRHSVREHATQVACRFRDRQLDYQTLGRQVDALAGRLRADGAGPGTRVGIYLPTCLEAFVAVHAVLRAGAAYVPLDPKLPLERLAFILDDCAISQLITGQQNLPRLRQLDAPVLDRLLIYGPEPVHGVNSAAWEAVISRSAGSDWPEPGADDAAYIMYTSGSTGHPKGIVHTHASGLAYARAAAEAFAVRPHDRVAGFAPLHFDQSTFHLFSAPLAGAAVVLVPDEYGSFPVNLARLIDAERISIWYSVPYALMQMAARGNLDAVDWRHLRWVKFGGETFPPKYLRALMQRLPGTRFANIYGPAEVNQCTHHVLDQAPTDDETIPIGKPWSCAQLAVVNEHLQDVAAGEQGELLVAASTMMSGYWGRDDLNRSAFVQRPGQPGAQPAQRYYRTGDLVRQRADGSYDFLGRRDRQVKARGYRIELDEVEAALLAHQAVAEAAAYVRTADDGSQQLEAALILHGGEEITDIALVQHLAKRLPRYSIPVKLHFCNSFPRTGSGKIDRRQLAAGMNPGQLTPTKKP